MPHRDARRAVVLRVEPQSASSRTTIYFESNHSQLQVKPQFGKHAQHARQRRCHGMKHIER